MENYNYRKAVKADVDQWIGDNEYWMPSPPVADRDAMTEYLDEHLWIDDAVTGNGSGSYTFNSAAAKDFVLADLDTVREAFEEFDEKERFADLFFGEEWETIDVITRCYCLYGAIAEAVAEMPSYLFEDEAAEKYAVIDAPRRGDGDVFTAWFSDADEAEEEAAKQWDALTPAERKNRRVYVLASGNYDPDAPDHMDGNIHWDADLDAEEV